MDNDLSGSVLVECTKRLENLYKQSHIWLLQVSFNICKSTLESEDLVMELYEYLHKKQNIKLFYDNSYNLMYCMAFLRHRWINKTKKLNRIKYQEDIYHDDPLEEYDLDKDLGITKAYNEVMSEIERLKKTKHFAPAMIYEMYWNSDDTLQAVADKIGISKSTTFIAIKKIRKHLKLVIDNPFNDRT
jgi:DNA-directed RNA polymerase specialized sigma24 family protein